MIGIIVTAAMTAMSFIMSIESLMPPLQLSTQRAMWSASPIQHPSVADLIAMRFYKIIDVETYRARMKEYGFDTNVADNMFEVSRSPLATTEIIAARRRGIIDEKTYYDYMSKQRFVKEDADTIYKVSEYFPTPADLIRFAVREVYTPEVVERFGQMEDFPPVFATEAAKAGLPLEQARNYWAAHWDLPSATQGFEMFHRGVIDEETLKMLMRALDIMPYWRDKLIQIAYRVYTRVDVRRMYRDGVLDREGVKRAYLDLGYDETKAENMTKFTLAFYTQKERDATESFIRKLYGWREIDMPEALSMLQEIGYTREMSMLKVAVWDLELADALLSEKVQNLKVKYIEGAISEAELSDGLDSLALPAVRKDVEILDAKTKREARVRLPTKKELFAWFMDDVIDEAELREYFTRYNYREVDIDRYVADFKKAKEAKLSALEAASKVE